MSSLATRVLFDLVARDRASKTFDKVGVSATRLEKTSASAGKAIAKGLALGTAALAGIGAVSAKAATDFQAEMTRISTQAGGTTKDVKILSDQVLKLGGKVQQGPKELADSLYHLKSVGMDNVSAMKALKEAADLAAVGHANLEETTNALAGAWRTGIKGATSFHEAVSTVNAIIGAGNMSMDQFNAAIGTGILPSAKTFGLSMRQVGAALALMTDEGIDSASAATRLRMSFSLLGAPSGAAEDQLKSIGLTGLKLANAMRGRDGLIGALTLLKDHLDASGLSAAQQSQLLSRAFGGGRSSSGILLMLNNLDVLVKKQNQINHSIGKFDDAVKQQRKTAQAEWARLTTGLESMSVRLGLAILPPITGFVGFINDKALPAAARFGRTMGSLVPVGKIKKAIGDVKTTVGGFLSGLTRGTGVGGFFAGLTGGGSKAKAPKSPLSKFPTTVLYPLGGSPHLGSAQTSSKGGKGLQALPHYGVGQTAPTTGVQGPALAPLPHGGSGLAAPLVKPAEAAKKPKSAAQQLGETIRKAVTGGIENIDWGKLGSSLGKGLGTAIGWLGKHAADLTKKLAGVFAGIDWVNVGKSVGATAIPFAVGFVTDLFKPLLSLDFWKKHWKDVIFAIISVVPIGRLAGGLAKVLKNIPILKVVAPLLEKLSGLGKFVEKGFGKVFGPLGRGLKKGFLKAFPKAEGIVSDLAERFVFSPARRLKTLAKLLPRAVGNGIENGTSFLTEKALGLMRTIGSPFAKAGRFLWDKGIALVKGLKGGAVDGIKGIGGWAKRTFVDPVVNTVKNWFGIHSPSTVFAGIGGDLIRGFKNGLSNVAKGIGGWVWNHTGKPAVNAFKGAGSWLWSKGKSLVSGLTGGILDRAKGIGSWAWTHVAKPQIDAFKNAGSWLWSKGRSLVSGLTRGVVDRAKGIGGWAWRTVAKPQIDAFKNAGTWLKDKGGQLISGMKNGITDKIKGIGKWVKGNIVDPVVGAVKHFFGIKSPSRVFMGIGGHLVTGLLKGMATTNGTAIAKTVFGDLPSALGHIVGKGLVSISKLPSKALHALGGLGGDILGLLGLGGGSGGGSSANQKIGSTLAAVRGWTGANWAALKSLWNGESGWNEHALNKASGAYGIPQSLPASKMASAGSDWRTNPATQIKWGLNYIASVYGNPVNAYAKWLSRSPHWYAKGTGGAARGLAWVGEKGPELVQFGGGETVLNHEQSMAFAQSNGIRLPGYAFGTIMTASDRVRRDRARVEDAKDAVARAKRRHKGVKAAEKRLQAAEKELKAAEIALANAKRSAKVSISNTIKTGLLKTLETGTASSIASAIKSLATKLLNAGYSKTAAAIQKKGSRLETLADKRASIQKTIAAANQYATDQSSRITDFLGISGTSATSIGGLISQLTGQEKTAANFVALTKSLKARGASKALLQQLADAGPGSQLAAILGDKNVKQSDIAKLNGLVKSGGKLATSFGRDMADLMYDSGKDAGKGFLAGLKSQEKALQKSMDALAKALISQIKKSLKIKSPSVLMRDQVGKQVALGMAVGMDRHRHHVAAAGRRLATAAVAASGGHAADRAFDRMAQRMGADGFNAAFDVQVNYNDPALRDLIDVQVTPKIKASQSEQAYRAKVGRR